MPTDFLPGISRLRYDQYELTAQGSLAKYRNIVDTPVEANSPLPMPFIPSVKLDR